MASFLDNILANLPEVAPATQKNVPFKTKLKWTLTILVLFFAMGLIPLFGLGQNALQQFEYLSLILGAEFGSLMSLGIGPIVTASIVLQLLNGSGIVKFDLTSREGKMRFQGIQKLLSIFFILFEAFIYVFMGGLAPAAEITGALKLQLDLLLIFQLFLGGLMVMFMDEVVSKHGFGSGISLFIAAGVSKSVFVRLLSWLPSPANPEVPTGALWQLFLGLRTGDPQLVALMLAAILATIFVFMISIYGQAMKVEIPLSFGRIRGHGVRWPLSFIYTSNIPVILVAALLANIQLWGRLLQNWGHPLLGTFNSQGTPVSGFVSWIQYPNVVEKLIIGNIAWPDIWHGLVYLLFMIGGAVVFSYFWVQTSGMDARSQAKQIMSSGLQIPGFRQDPRVMERLLERYIGPLTVMGAIFVGFIAASADLIGALSSGTGILLTVMIIYKLYEDIARKHMFDMHPAMRKFMKF
ncbi:preprotein translocase subunit SecY [Candidatus Woesearchaeota archaeon]|nr:preprotein translocase subunit SecY [Candidatus Woesearchaeota archaeon]